MNLVFLKFIFGYCLLLIMGLLFFVFFLNMKTSDVAVISNIFVWSATLFAPITAFFIFNGWKSQHNKTVERELADNLSLCLSKQRDAIGQIYYVMYLNKITHPVFYPLNDDPLPKYIENDICNFNKEAIQNDIIINKDLARLCRKNPSLKQLYNEYVEGFNNLHKNLFYFFDARIAMKMPSGDLNEDTEKFKALYDHYHFYRKICEELDAKLDNIIFV